MLNTTIIKKAQLIKKENYKCCHGGNGTLEYRKVLTSMDIPSKRLQFMHHDILPPGASIGVHKHEIDEEYYYFLSGKGVMHLNAMKMDVEAGDIAGVFPGGTHALENNSREDLCFLVVSVLV